MFVTSQLWKLFVFSVLYRVASNSFSIFTRVASFSRADNDRIDFVSEIAFSPRRVIL